MAFLPEIGTYLAATVTDTALTLGTNLFLGRLPDTPDTCVALFETGGLTPAETMGGSSLACLHSAEMSDSGASR
jgi:hypothetical protein